MCQQLKLTSSNIRIRDHQHITYDLFAKQKGYSGVTAHKMRAIPERYKSQQVYLPEDNAAITYAVINLTINNRIVSMVDIDPKSLDSYNPLYTYLTDTFSLVAKRFNLNNGALIANSLVPIVRFSEQEIVSRIGELQMLGYNPLQSPCGIISKWQADQLVDDIQLIFVASKDNNNDHGYGKFLNQIQKALRLFATELKIVPEKEELTVRFHQHIAYNL